MDWKPKLSYRYAFFEGDDPATSTNEAFDPLFPGFYDWGTWWQGEIAGEYFLSNSNLISHQVRLHLTPSESVGAGLIGYVFQLDQPASLAPGVTSKDVASELDAYCRLEAQHELHRELRRGVRRPAGGREAGLRPDQELHLRDGVPCLRLLTGDLNRGASPREPVGPYSLAWQGLSALRPRFGVSIDRRQYK